MLEANPNAITNVSAADAGNPADTALIHRIGGSLTVIKGHAQLIRRRDQGHEDARARYIERSLLAIEHAVDEITSTLRPGAFGTNGERTPACAPRPVSRGPQSQSR